MGAADASCGPSQSIHAAACFYCLIFTDKKSRSQQQEFLSDPTYRKFSGDCSWNPKSNPQKLIAQSTDWRFLTELKKELKG